MPAIERTDSRAKRPIQITFGSVVSFARGGLFLLLGAVLICAPAEVLAEAGAEVRSRGSQARPS